MWYLSRQYQSLQSYIREGNICAYLCISSMCIYNSIFTKVRDLGGEIFHSREIEREGGVFFY